MITSCARCGAFLVTDERHACRRRARAAPRVEDHGRCTRCRAQRGEDYRGDAPHERLCFGCHLTVPVPAAERPVTL
jgi:hypothetical protein